MNIQEISTSRLNLRQFRESDFDDYAEMLSDEDVMQFIGEGLPLSRIDAWRSMAVMSGHWQLKQFGLWALEEKESGKFIGRAGIYYPEGWPGIEIGWMLKRDYWGKGYAFECAQKALSIAFEEMKIDKVISIIHPKNTASIKLAKKLGESFEKDSKISIGDTVASIYSITKKQG